MHLASMEENFWKLRNFQLNQEPDTVTETPMWLNIKSERFANNSWIQAIQVPGRFKGI